MRALLLLAALAMGCGADQKAWEARAGLLKAAQENPAECVARASEVIAMLEKEHGDPPRYDPNVPMEGADLGSDYHLRALCRRKLGEKEAAMADLEKALALEVEYCRRARAHKLFAAIIQKQCQQAADDTELVAQWKRGQ